MPGPGCTRRSGAPRARGLEIRGVIWACISHGRIEASSSGASGYSAMSDRTVFLAALERSDPAERTAYLDEVCAGDPALRQRVEALLRSHEEAGSFLEQPALHVADQEVGADGGPGGTQTEPGGDDGIPSFEFL